MNTALGKEMVLDMEQNTNTERTRIVDAVCEVLEQAIFYGALIVICIFSLK